MTELEAPPVDQEAGGALTLKAGVGRQFNSQLSGRHANRKWWICVVNVRVQFWRPRPLPGGQEGPHRRQGQTLLTSRIRKSLLGLVALGRPGGQPGQAALACLESDVGAWPLGTSMKLESLNRLLPKVQAPLSEPVQVAEAARSLPSEFCSLQACLRSSVRWPWGACRPSSRGLWRRMSINQNCSRESDSNLLCANSCGPDRRTLRNTNPSQTARLAVLSCLGSCLPRRKRGAARPLAVRLGLSFQKSRSDAQGTSGFRVEGVAAWSHAQAADDPGAHPDTEEAEEAERWVFCCVASTLGSKLTGATSAVTLFAIVSGGDVFFEVNENFATEGGAPTRPETRYQNRATGEVGPSPSVL